MGSITAISDTQGPPMCREQAIQQLTTIFGSHLRSLTRIAARIMSDADAEDTVQDAFLSAYSHVNQYRGHAKMSTWVTAIVINAARMKARARSRQLHISLDLENRQRKHQQLSEILPDRRSSPEQLYRSSELMERLAQASIRLSPPLRRAFQLTDLEGLGIHKTARVMGITHSAVKSRVTRARKKLKRLLQTQVSRSREFNRKASNPQSCVES